jgi:hypothetical protein
LLSTGFVRIILPMMRARKTFGALASLTMGLCLTVFGPGCKDRNPLGDDFGIELVEPLSVSWGPEPEYHASSGEPLSIRARAATRVDWRVEITSNTGGKVIHDDTILQTVLNFTETLPFIETIHTPDVFSPGDTVTVRVLTVPEVKPSQAHRAVFQFVILP